MVLGGSRRTLDARKPQNLGTLGVSAALDGTPISIFKTVAFVRSAIPPRREDSGSVLRGLGEPVRAREVIAAHEAAEATAVAHLEEVAAVTWTGRNGIDPDGKRTRQGLKG